MRTWDELIDDGATLAKSFVTNKTLTGINKMIWVSEAQAILQKKTKAVRRDFLLETNVFDSNGSVSATQGIAGTGGGYASGLKVERLIPTVNPLVFTISAVPLGDVAISDGAELMAGVDFTISNQTVTFLFGAPVNPYATYIAVTAFNASRYYEVGTLVRAEYYPASSALPSGEVFIIGYDQLMQMRRAGSMTNGSVPPQNPWNAIALAVHAGRIYLYPQAGLGGSFVITHIPKLSKYSVVQGALATGYWANYAANLNLAMTTLGPEPEFDYAEEGMAAYVAAQFLDSMPAARAAYAYKYEEWMRLFQSCYEDVIAADVPYNISQGPKGYSGPAGHWR